MEFQETRRLFPVGKDGFPSLAEQVRRFLVERQGLIGQFANPNSEVAERAIARYQEMLNERITQVHTATPKKGRLTAESVLIDSHAQRALWQVGNGAFPRFRYPRTGTPGAYKNPEPPLVLRGWYAEGVDPSDALAVLFSTTTTLWDDTTTVGVMLAVRDSSSSPWQLGAAFQLGCSGPPWDLVNRTLTMSDMRALPPDAPLSDDLGKLFALQAAMVKGTAPQPFRRYKTTVTAKVLYDYLAREEEYTNRGTDALMSHLVNLLTGREQLPR